MSQATVPLHIPTAIDVKLRDIRQREFRWALLRTAAVATTIFMLAITVALAIDAAFQLRSPSLRTGLTMTVGMLPLLFAVHAIWQQWQRAQQPTHAAVLADRHLPQLQERWQTIASLSRSPYPPQNPLAASMWQQVTQEGVVLSRLVQPEAISTPQSMRAAWGVCLLCGLPLGIWLLINTAEVSILLQRFCQPWKEITATQLTALLGDQRIARGEAIDLAVQLTGLPRNQARLQIQRDDQSADQFTLAPVPDDQNRFQQRIRVDRAFRYKFIAGDGETPWHVITVMDFPALIESNFRVEAPRYSQRPLLEKSHLPQRLKVVAGSRLQWLFRTNMPLARCDLAWTSTEVEEAISNPVIVQQPLKPQPDGWYVVELVLQQSGTLELLMTNLYGLEPDEPIRCRIQVLEDQIPVARILGNPEDAVAADDETLTIDFEAHDDLGIARAQLVVYDESGESRKILHVQEIPLGDQLLQKHVLGSVQLDLAALQLPAGSQISYAIRVMDNRDGYIDHPNEGSEELAANSSQEKNGSATNRDRRPQPDPKDATSSDMAASADGQNADDLAASPQSAREHDDSRDIAQGPISALWPANLRDLQSETTPQDQSNAVSALRPENLRQPRGDTTTTDPMIASADRSQRKPGESGPSSRVPDPLSPVSPTDASTPSNNAEHANGASPSSEAATASPSPASQREPTQRTASGSSPPPPDFRQTAGQESPGTETQSRRITIVERLTALAKADDVPLNAPNIREQVIQIDTLLGVVENGLLQIIDRAISDAARRQQFEQLDLQLERVEQAIAKLREATRDNQFAFIGLQMVDISRTHVMPARERVFIAQRESVIDSSRSATRSLQSVVRARELLATLLVRYDRSQRDAKLAKSLEEAGKIYDVYVERSQMLLREAQQNRHPLERKMEFVEVDQDYLDRYAEVLRLRRDMLDEFARLLGDDPRLLSRFLELSKQRRASLREQLASLTEQQQVLTDEVAGWLQVDESQREALLTLLIEARWEWAGDLAKDSAALAEHIEKQLPLVLDASYGPSQQLIQDAQSLAVVARDIALDARLQLRNPDAEIPWRERADRFLTLSRQVETDLDRLSFNYEQQTEVIDYVTTRLREARVVSDQAVRWSQVVDAYQRQQYAGLAKLDQQQLALTTELLRGDMLDIPTDLANEFAQRPGATVPSEILTMVEQLQMAVEAATFNQQAATYALEQSLLNEAAEQQARAFEALERAEKLFDQMRRKVVEVLDDLPVDNPNIADLRDPTLDEFLAQLEREPNLEARLGLPNRRRNLRTLLDNLESEEDGAGLLNEAGESARSRARQVMREPPPKAPTPPQELTDEERQQQELAEKQQQQLTEALNRINEKLKDSKLSPEQRSALEQVQRQMHQALKNASTAANRRWQQLAEADQAQAALQALARGQKIPDDQWNKVLSSLGDGLWQVGGRTPPEDYRRAIEQYQNRIRMLLEGTPIEEQP
ncbi:hypothetical protein GC163_01160 [bacterium]|nr:hypothetical protein [bacterium]